MSKFQVGFKNFEIRYSHLIQFFKVNRIFCPWEHTGQLNSKKVLIIKANHEIISLTYSDNYNLT